MSNENSRQLCQIVARLTDALEGVAREVRASDHEISRIHNIRQDILHLLNALGPKKLF